MAETSIEWTDWSINPVRARDQATNKVGHYCEKISAGCANCYASGLQRRFGTHPFPGAGKPMAENIRPFLDESKLQEVLRRKKPTRIFWCDMTDLFGHWVPDEWIGKCFATMALTPQHTHQVLTKRPERMQAYCRDESVAGRVARAADRILVANAISAMGRERIKEIPGFPCYYASDRGVILSAKRGEMAPMKPDEGEQGHQRVQLHREESGKRGDRLLVHRLILETFVGPAPSPESQGCHRDGDPRNNALPNLRWGTQSENWVDRKRHGNGRSHSVLTIQEVEQIKGFRLAHMRKEAVAERFGISATQVTNIERGDQWAARSDWPLPNCWLGVSVENQAAADERIPLLLQTPAAVRFLSVEPLLGPVNLRRVGKTRRGDDIDARLGTITRYQYKAMNDSECSIGVSTQCSPPETNKIDWCIIGGESGPGARECRLPWIRSLVQQCRSAGVSCFVKQLGSNFHSDGEVWPDAPRHVLTSHRNGMIQNTIDLSRFLNGRWKFRDRKGGYMGEWPEDIRVREFPA